MRVKRKVLIFSLVITAVIAGVFIQRVFQDDPRVRSGPSSPDRQSLVQLRTLALACFAYASQNNDQFPEPTLWRSLLIAQDIVDPVEFKSPFPGATSDSYQMAPNAIMWDKRSILLYEDPEHWPEFVNVAFGDASADQLPHDEFLRLLAEQTTDSP